GNHLLEARPVANLHEAFLRDVPDLHYVLGIATGAGRYLAIVVDQNVIGEELTKSQRSIRQILLVREDALTAVLFSDLHNAGEIVGQSDIDPLPIEAKSE